MSVEIPTDNAGSSAAHTILRRRPPIRVAIISDLLEEQWHSMDLVGDMLSCHLKDNHSDEVVVTQLRPQLRQRLTGVPLLPEKLARNADRLMNRFADYPLWLRRRRDDFDLFHLVDHSYAHLIHGLPSKRTVVTCHDLDTFRCLIEPEKENRPHWFRMMTQRILDGFRNAAHVLAVSANTRDQLLRHRIVPAERISVVANGVHPCYSPLADLNADAAATHLLPGNDRESLWLLNVGSTLPRKRLDLLLRVFAALRQEVPEARLVRVGGSFTPAQLHLASELKVEDAVVTLPFLERGILAAVYRRAALLIHTAEAEGFGLPLIEAMACGCPVVASDIPVLREVGGLAVAYCPVGDVDAWKSTVVALLHDRIQQNSVWTLGVQNGLTHSAGYSWAKNARQTARIYREVLATCS